MYSMKKTNNQKLKHTKKLFNMLRVKEVHSWFINYTKLLFTQISHQRGTVPLDLIFEEFVYFLNK